MLYKITDSNEFHQDENSNENTNDKHSEEDLHFECWKPVKNPVTQDIIGIVNSYGIFHKIMKDNNSSKILEPDTNYLNKNAIGEKIAKLTWDLDWTKMTKDLKELKYIYICCSKTRDDLTSLESEISTAMTPLQVSTL